MQGGGQPLGAEEGRGGVQQGEGTEQAEEEVQRAGRVAVELTGRDEAAEDLPGGPVQPLPLRQGAGEQGDQAPAEEHGDEQAEAQDEQGPPEGTGPGGGVELLAGGDQDPEGGDGDGHRGAADPVVVVGDDQQVDQDEQGQIGDDDPPGDLLAGAEGGGEQEEEDGVGQVGADGHDDLVEEPHDVPQEVPQRRGERQ